MDAVLYQVNWLAVLVGTVLGFGLGMVWFGQLFGKIWTKGSHNITPPASPPLLAMAGQLLGTFLMAWIIGATAMMESLCSAVLVILAIATLQFSGSLFSQKSLGASVVDGSFVLAMGVLMIAAQAIL